MRNMRIRMYRNLELKDVCRMVKRKTKINSFAQKEKPREKVNRRSNKQKKGAITTEK